MDETIFGRYRLISLIGVGGMGRVFKAHDTMIDRDVAIKVLPTELAAEPGFRERFRREAHIAAQLAEPHVIPIYDVGDIDGRLYLVMPVIDGIDVASLLRRDGPMSPRLAVKVIEQLASALDGAHQHGLVHRDVKPSNALMTRRDFVYLIDFGIAHDTAATHLTRTGSVLGTLAYMAPERFEGKADARADVYALAGVLHECLTGRQPFPGDSLPQQMHGHLSVDPPRPSAQRRSIPMGFDEVVARGMAKNPDERYQTAGELADAAQHALTESAPERQTRTASTIVDDRENSGQIAPAPATEPLPPDPAPASTLVDGDEQPTELATLAKPRSELPGSRRRGKRLMLAAGGVLLAAIVAAVVIVATATSNESQTALPTSTTPATTSPAPAPPPLARLRAAVAPGLQCGDVQEYPDPKPLAVSWVADINCTSGTGLYSLQYRLFEDASRLDSYFSAAGSILSESCPAEIRCNGVRAP